MAIDECLLTVKTKREKIKSSTFKSIWRASARKQLFLSRYKPLVC